MALYLADHPPKVPQYRPVRRASVTGAIVVHTAENTPDADGIDDGAEGVAHWISVRPDQASYHTVVDSNTIVRIVPYEAEAFHESTGGNRFSLGLSIATRADRWDGLPPAWVEGALRNAAREATSMARWVKAARGIEVPAVHITAADYRAGKPGFVGHGELDPSRRTDPGARFPWGRFLTYFAQEMGATTPQTKEEPAVAEPAWDLTRFSAVMAEVRELYSTHRGPKGDNRSEIDAWGRDLAAKLARGEDVRPTLNFIQSALAAEPRS